MIDTGLRYERLDGGDVQEVPDGYVVYQPDRDRVHFLNPTAVIVYELCDGRHSVEAICAVLADLFDLETWPIGDVETCLTCLTSERLIRPAGRDTPSTSGSGA